MQRYLADVSQPIKSGPFLTDICPFSNVRLPIAAKKIIGIHEANKKALCFKKYLTFWVKSSLTRK